MARANRHHIRDLRTDAISRSLFSSLCGTVSGGFSGCSRRRGTDEQLRKSQRLWVEKSNQIPFELLLRATCELNHRLLLRMSFFPNPVAKLR